jgi:hypothetical protein
MTPFLNKRSANVWEKKMKEQTILLRNKIIESANFDSDHSISQVKMFDKVRNSKSRNGEHSVIEEDEEEQDPNAYARI